MFSFLAIFFWKEFYFLIPSQSKLYFYLHIFFCSSHGKMNIIRRKVTIQLLRCVLYYVINNLIRNGLFELNSLWSEYNHHQCCFGIIKSFLAINPIRTGGGGSLSPPPLEVFLYNM